MAEDEAAGSESALAACQPSLRMLPGAGMPTEGATYVGAHGVNSLLKGGGRIAKRCRIGLHVPTRDLCKNELAVTRDAQERERLRERERDRERVRERERESERAREREREQARADAREESRAAEVARLVGSSSIYVPRFVYSHSYILTRISSESWALFVAWLFYLYHPGYHPGYHPHPGYHLGYHLGYHPGYRPGYHPGQRSHARSRTT
jgi:hypothetical protein